MTLDEFIARACPIIGSVGSAFYFAPETVAVGKANGIDGFRFYFLGRGGVLGDVEPAVVQSAFGYFAPAVVTRMWTTAREKMAPRDAARLYMKCAHEFGRAKFGALAEIDAFNDAAEKVVRTADVAGLALFAGIAAEPLAADGPARAMQLTAVLREFRGSAHLVAVLASGLEARIAHYLRRPNDYTSFGWPDPYPEGTDDDRRKLAAADALTDQLVTPAYGVLEVSERAVLLSGLRAMQAALAG